MAPGERKAKAQISDFITSHLHLFQHFSNEDYMPPAYCPNDINSVLVLSLMVLGFLQARGMKAYDILNVVGNNRNEKDKHKGLLEDRKVGFCYFRIIFIQKL